MQNDRDAQPQRRGYAQDKPTLHALEPGVDRVMAQRADFLMGLDACHFFTHKRHNKRAPIKRLQRANVSPSSNPGLDAFLRPWPLGYGSRAGEFPK